MQSLCGQTIAAVAYASICISSQMLLPLQSPHPKACANQLTYSNSYSSPATIIKETDAIDVAWQNAQQYLLLHYSPEKPATVASAESVEDVVKHLKQLQAQVLSWSSFRWITNIQLSLDSLRRYEEILKVYSNSHMAVALLWGSANLILVVRRYCPYY
jgi:hypothetical protein